MGAKIAGSADSGLRIILFFKVVKMAASEVQWRLVKSAPDPPQRGLCGF